MTSQPSHLTPALMVAIAAVILPGGCQLTAYPSGAIPCEVGGADCPDGYICVDPRREDSPRCHAVGCGDGAVNLARERCDDANANELDRCTRECAEVQHLVVEGENFGLGEGDGDARRTPLGRPTTIAADRSGALYVASAGANRTLRLSLDDAKGRWQVAPIAGNGTMLGGVVVGSARSDRISTTFATSLAVDGFGTVFIGDFQDSVIHRLDGVTGLVETIGGTGVDLYTRGDDLPADLISLSRPTGLVVDDDGLLYFAEREPFIRNGVLFFNQSVRRLDPDTGTVRTILFINDFPGAIDDLMLDRDGQLYAMSRPVVQDRETGRIDRFVAFTLLDKTGATPNQVPRQSTEIHTHSTDAAERRVPGGLNLPGIGNGQAHAVTDDGQHFHVLMGDQLVELNTVDRSGAVVATFPLALTDEGFLNAGDDDAAAIPFSIRPTDLVRHGDDIFVVDPGNGGVWQVGANDRDRIVQRTEQIAGKVPGQPVSGLAVSTEIALGFAREADGRVGVGASQDCGATGLNARALEFLLAFPDVHRVLFSNCRSNVSILAGTGQPGNTGDGERADLATLNRPAAMVRIDLDGPGVVTERDAFYIADSGNNSIRRLRALDVGNGLQIDTFIGGEAPTAPGAARSVDLDRPSGLAVDDVGRLLIADTGHHRVLRVDVDTGDVDTIFGTGSAEFNGDAQAPTATAINEPSGLIFLPMTLIVQVLNPGSPPPAPGTAPGGFLIVAERAGQRVRGVFVPPIANVPPVLTLAGDGIPGDEDDTGDVRGRLRFPRSLMFGLPDIAERRLSLYAVDAFDRIRILDLGIGGAQLVAAALGTIDGRGGASRLDGPRGTAAFRAPSALTALDERRLLVVDRSTGRLRRVTLGSDGDALTVSGLPEGQGVVDFDADGKLVPVAPVPASTAAPLIEPGGIALDAATTPPTLWVGEAGAGRLRRFRLVDPDAAETWTTEAVIVEDASGTPLLVRPEGLALVDGTLFVADAGAHVVVAVDTASLVGRVIAGSGARGAGAAGRDARATDLNGPAGVAARDGVIVVADTGNNRVLRLDLVGPDAGRFTALLGDGTASLGGEGRPARTFPVRQPRGLAIDAAGNVVVAAGSALRFIGAGDPVPCGAERCPAHVADGEDEVSTIFGAPGTTTFPEVTTRCLDDVIFTPAARIVTVDSCGGFVLPLVREVVPPSN